MSATIAIKRGEEARSTIREWAKIDRGFLNGPGAAALTLAAVVLIPFSAGAAAGLAGVLAVDFSFFCWRRIRTLRRYEKGRPRLRSAQEFSEASQAFSDAGVSEPTMTDWEEAAGFGGRPQWRVGLRYEEMVRLYCGEGVVADIGCGDGRLCWRYHICPPESYIGVDVARGLLALLCEKTGGKARAIEAVAEHTQLAGASVDFIACTEAFEHLPEPGLAVREFDRVLRRGGLAVIQSPNATRLRNLNPFHIASCILGIFFPALLMRKVVQENTFLRVYTYHWDFTRQDVRRYVRQTKLRIRRISAATYRFNPDGSMFHRAACRVAKWRWISWAWGDLTVTLEKV